MPGPGIHLLFVCTGNIFRSPMAQAFLDALARDRRLDITSESAGTLPGKRPIAAGALEVIAPLGLDMSGHRSHQIDVPTIQRSDLVVGMAREHVREAVTIEPSSWQRAFTLKQLVRLGEATGARPKELPLADWLQKVGAGRDRWQLMGSSPEDDVEDPIGGGPGVYRAVGREVHDLVGRVVDLIRPDPLAGDPT